jgi:hypothetical protein
LLRIMLTTLLALSLQTPLNPNLVAALPNTTDSATIPASWAMVRIQKLSVDSGGVYLHLKTGEKIRSISISPRHQIKAQPLNGQLCQEKCSGSAPTILHIYRIKPVTFPTALRRGDGGSIVTVTTNSNNTYSFDAAPGFSSKRIFYIK